MSLNQLVFRKFKTNWMIKNDILVKGSQYVTEGGLPDDVWDKLVHAKPMSIIGIDPGKNFGVAVVCSDGDNLALDVFNGRLDDINYPLREVAFWFIQNFITGFNPTLTASVIEGASYGDKFGQVKLAEARTGFALGCSELGLSVTTVAPKTPRKVVFGSGNTGAWDVWLTLNHNAADALCLALYPFYKEIE